MIHGGHTWSAESCEEVREALKKIGERFAHDAMEEIDPDVMYTPKRHGVALAFNRPLIIGGRGVGKSFWARALYQTDTRERAADAYPNSGLANTRARYGFAGGVSFLDDPRTPAADELQELLLHGSSPQTIWRAVFLSLLGDEENADDTATLKELAHSDYSGDRPFGQRVLEAEKERSEGQRFLMVCDALDRLSNKWEEVRELSKGLLQLALDLRGFRRLGGENFHAQ